MLIQNYSKLILDSKTKNALDILECGLNAAMPENFMNKFVKKGKIILGKKIIKMSDFENIYLISFGKAAFSMAKAINSQLKIKKGLVILPKNLNPKINEKKLHVIYSSHPTPSKKSVDAAKEVLRFIDTMKKKDFVIFLVSGGSSALLTLPNGISLGDKIKVNNLLLKCGASIQEINCIRKHLSKIKGGQLVNTLPCKSAALVMSDVQGDDLSSIASGITYFDKTTFKDALRITSKYNLENKIPKSVLSRLRDGLKGKVAETPKKSKIPNKVVANNQLCIDAMVNKAKKLGYSVRTILIFEDVNTAAKKLVNLLPLKKNSCIIFGGEPTVRVTGKGKGGRNQELILQIAQRIKSNLVISSLGTDGIDGNTKFAGAIMKSGISNRKEILSYLSGNNSNGFFKKHGGLIKTGRTQTNLMDIGLIIN